MAEPTDREKRMAELKSAREKTYFEAQAAAKTEAASKLAPTPAPDAFVYSNVWRQDVGGAGGRFNLVKTPNPYYDPATNTIVDPKTGERKPAGISMLQSGTAFPSGLASIPGKTVTSITRNTDGTITVRYSDNTRTITNASGIVISSTAGAAVGSNTGVTAANATDTTGVTTGNTSVTGTGTTQTATGAETSTTSTGLTAQQLASQSAFEVFRGFLRQYGLEGLAPDIEKYKLEGLSDDELLMRLRTESKAYQRRFKANEARIAKGLTALSEAEYIGLEDKYQDVMRRYGLPESYYTRGEMGRQEGFEKFIAGDVSPTELEDRIQTAQNRVINAAPEVSRALKEYFPEVTNGDILAYVLDPENSIGTIKRKITTSEIGSAAFQAALGLDVTRASELQRYGVTGETARQGFQTIAGVLPRASTLSDIYAKQGAGPYTQTTAEQEVFGLAGAAEAQRKRQRLSALEQAQFSGSAGAAGGALARERAGQF